MEMELRPEAFAEEPAAKLLFPVALADAPIAVAPVSVVEAFWPMVTVLEPERDWLPPIATELGWMESLEIPALPDGSAVTCMTSSPLPKVSWELEEPQSM